MNPILLMGAFAAGAVFGSASTSTLRRHVPRAAWVAIVATASSLAIVVEATDVIGLGAGMAAVLGLVVGAGLADYRHQLVQDSVDEALAELAERDASGAVINGRALELMRPALESKLRRRGTIDPSRPRQARFEDVGRFDVLGDPTPSAYESLRYAEGEDSRNVLATGVLWHTRTLGVFDGRAALRIDHVIDRHQLTALENHVRRLPSERGVQGWDLLGLSPHTANSNGRIVLAVPDRMRTGSDAVVSELYEALNDIRHP